MDGPAIAIVRSSRPWARALHRYVADYGGAVVRARPLEERQALEEDYHVLLVDDISSFLTHRLVQELHRLKRRVLGVYDPTEHPTDAKEAGKERLKNLGVDEVIDAQAAPEEFLRAIHALAPDSDVDHEFQQLVAGIEGHSGLLSPATEGEQRRGLVTAVVGTAGGAGATEVAIELGRAIRRRGEVGVIVDADELAPSIAQRLGLPLHPNIRAAVDALEHGTGLLADCLMSDSKGETILLTGLPHAKDWIALRPDEVMGVINEMAGVCHHVVVNVADHIEDLGGLGGIDRFGISRTVVNESDVIVVVGMAGPLGVARTLDRVAEITSMGVNAPIHIVLNRAPSSSFKRGELLEEIQRTFVPAGLHFIPSDKRVEEAAWQGTLAESGPFSDAVSALAKAALGSTTSPSSNNTNKKAKRSKRGWLSRAS